MTNSLECKNNDESNPGCANETFILTPYSDQFSIFCVSSSSCKNADISISFTNNTVKTALNHFGCGSMESCFNTNINIKSYQSAPTIINRIQCNSRRSCANSKFTIHSVSNIYINEINCNDFESCLNMQFYINTNSNPNQYFRIHLNCAAQSSCFGTKIYVNTMKYNVSVTCSGKQSCINSHLIDTQTNISYFLDVFIKRTTTTTTPSPISVTEEIDPVEAINQKNKRRKTLRSMAYSITGTLIFITLAYNIYMCIRLKEDDYPSESKDDDDL